MLTFLHTVQTYSKLILQFILPGNATSRRLENMSAVDFALAARRVQDELPQDIYSLFKYRDTLVRQALWELKYKGNRRVAKLFAQLLYETIFETVAEEELYTNFTQPIIIPIPLSKQRQKERGWNQAEMIGKEIVKLCPEWQLETKVLFKIRHTKPQTKLHRDARLQNLKGCFAIPEDAHLGIRNRNIILLDDVTTTGSTIIEAKNTLLAAGARRVLAYTVAH